VATNVRDVEVSGSQQPLPRILFDLAAGRLPQDREVCPGLLAVAKEHRMTGLLWSWARTNSTDRELKTDLAVYDLAMQAHLHRVWTVLETCAARLEAAGIEAATIKGVTAGARWYARTGDRPCSDVDLLVAPHEKERAGDIVRLLQPDHPWASHVAELARKNRIQAVTLVVDGLEVDLHFDPLKLYMPTRQAGKIWERARSYRLPTGVSIRVLDDTSSLLLFLVHLNKDRFQRLLGYSDIARIVGAGQVDWDELARLAAREGIEVPVLSTLDVVVRTLELTWPDDLDHPRGPRARAWRLLWPERIHLLGREGRLRFKRRQDWIPLLARGRGSEALAWWTRDLWPPAPLVTAEYAHIPGPYPWKLLRGRIDAARERRTRIEEGRRRVT
jgi:hypothetical protein